MSSVVTTLLLVVWISSAHQSLKQEGTLPIYGAVPVFELTDSFGKPFSSSQVRENVCIVNFIFTSCRGICPIMSHEMAKIQEKFSKTKGIRFISISVDPEVDTPERLAEYAGRFGANRSVWHFLTGKKEVIEKLMIEGFKLGFDNEPVFHSDYFVLLDPQSRIRGYYSFANKNVFKELPKDISRLLRVPN